jgi:hypothetical protein
MTLEVQPYALWADTATTAMIQEMSLYGVKHD